MKLLVFLASLNFVVHMDSGVKQGDFKIYCFTRNNLSFQLSRYDYDSTWTDFLQSADLKKASLVLTDTEIEVYDWETQEITLTPAGYENLKNFKRTSPLTNLIFIATCNEKRIYAGEFISYGSAMAINHPVIHFDIEHFRGDRKLRIYPVHSISRISELPPSIRTRTATDAIKSYFQRIGKLR